METNFCFEDHSSLGITLLSLPLETICNILYYLTPHETSQFARTSKTSAKIFKFDINKIIDQLITKWAVFIFRCPRCGSVSRSGSEVTSVILASSASDKGTLFQEQTYRSCRPCHYHIRKETMKKLNTFLSTYRSDRDHASEYRRIAYNGMCRYQTSGKYPRKKDLDFMQNIVKRVCAE